MKKLANFDMQIYILWIFFSYLVIFLGFLYVFLLSR